ncbi:hypothetical protein Bca4012_022761 [Brassica carinata]|uniref:RNase H type-1 domain-containing protein n=1 Tax=Brassica carinata TaxID=52824 RepID=A0A8X7THB2_BRACI|nr:hypothetical protein Bca52824_096399 [Brassica carinata]
MISGESELIKFASSEASVATPLIAEALAMREALRKCLELGIGNIMCESDFSRLISASQGKLHSLRFTESFSTSWILQPYVRISLLVGSLESTMVLQILNEDVYSLT